MGYYVPHTLQRLNNWVLWRLEDGKKKPFSAKYNGLASVAKPYQWSDYESARLKFTYTQPEYNGLGFVFSERCGLVFIDLDHCINEDSGELSDFAQEVVQLFASSYIEYSQSGSGLHIVCKGTIPAAYKGAQIELYSSGRYMAFTGNAYATNEPQEAQAALNELCKRFAITTQSREAQIEQQPITASDSAIIDKAERGANGTQFKALYAGEWESKYKTQSSADMRLIALLWYYSGNAEQVERLFLSSGLAARDKARRADYIQRTIATAARNTKTAAQQTNSSVTERGDYISAAPAKTRQTAGKGRSYWNK